MPLQFKKPYDIQTQPSGAESFLKPVGQAISTIPSIIMETEKLRNQRKQAAIENSHKAVESKLKLIQMGQTQTVLDPKTGETRTVPGVGGYEISFNDDGIADLVRMGETTPGSARPVILPTENTKQSGQETPEQKDERKKALEKPKALGSFKNTIRDIDAMIKEAQEIKDDPALPNATGWALGRSTLPGGATRVDSRLETLKAKTILNVLSSMKELSKNGASGFGALNELEGENIRNSVSSLNRKQETKDFKDSLDRFINEMSAKKQNLIDTFIDTYGDIPQNTAEDKSKEIQNTPEMIRVKNKKTGQTGVMPKNKFNETLYDIIQ